MHSIFSRNSIDLSFIINAQMQRQRNDQKFHSNDKIVSFLLKKNNFSAIHNNSINLKLKNLNNYIY